jgi:folate-binding protein YgfZ
LAQAIELWQQATLLTPNTQLNTALLSAGLALVTSHSTEQYLPQMLGLAASGAIDFDKGCYLGQEIVARAQHRGAVKRQLARLHWAHSADASKRWEATELTDDNNASLGKIINGLVAPDGSNALIGTALAVVSSKGDSFPAQARSNAAADPSANASPNNTPDQEPIYFQVSKIEN